MEEEKTTRKPGRPRKVTPVAAVEPPVVENNSAMTIEEENALMNEQLKTQFAMLKKLAEKQGLSLSDLYPTPPVADTVIEGNTVAVPLSIETDGTPTVVDAPVAEAPKKYKPGEYLPGGAWVPWTRGDLSQFEKVKFVPQPIPGLVFPGFDEEGRQKIKLDVNDLVCWLTVGIENEVTTYFWAVYDQAYQEWKKLEEFKRNGPDYAPWGKIGPAGQKAWHFEPMAPSFAMKADGRYLQPGDSVEDEATPMDEVGE